MSSPNLDTIPVEILESICDFVDNTGSLKSLRLVSRELRVKTQNVFAKRQFTHLNVGLQKGDLENLVAISAHPIFSKVVRTLRVAPRYSSDRFNPYYYHSFGSGPRQIENRAPFCGRLVGSPRQLQIATEKHHKLCQNQSEWRHSGEEADLLASAFHGINRLERLYIGLKDPEAVMKIPDPDTGQMVYSLHPISSPHHDSNNCDPASHGFGVVLAALVQRPLVLRELYAGSHSWPLRSSLNMEILKIPEMCRLTLQQSISKIKVLDLVVCLESDDNIQRHATHDNSLASFLSMMPEINSIGLRFDHGYNHEFKTDRDRADAKWIAMNLREVFLRVKLPKLRTLKLNGACLETTPLCRFLQRHRRHLESLELSSIRTLEWVTEGNPPLAQKLGSMIADLSSLVDLSLRRIMTAEGFVLFEPQDEYCVLCSGSLYGKICSHSTLKVLGEAVHSPDTAKRLSETEIARWTYN